MGSPSPKPPLILYVVWHPKFTGEQGGGAITDRLYRTLAVHPRRILSPGLGIPVRVRTSATEGFASPSI